MAGIEIRPGKSGQLVVRFEYNQAFVTRQGIRHKCNAVAPASFHPSVTALNRSSEHLWNPEAKPLTVQDTLDNSRLVDLAVHRAVPFLFYVLT